MSSLNGDYQEFWVGHYESSSGPYILDNKGNLTYMLDRGSYSVYGEWVKDNKYLSIQDAYEGQYIHVLDFDNNTKTILSEDLSSRPVIGINHEFKGLFYNEYGREHYLEIFVTDDYKQYIDLQIDGDETDVYGTSYVCMDQKVYITYAKESKLFIDEYSFEYEDIKSRDVKSSSFVTTEGYDWLYDNLFLSKTKRNANGEPSLFVYSEDRQRLIDVDSFDDLNKGKLYLNNDAY